MRFGTDGSGLQAIVHGIDTMAVSSALGCARSFHCVPHFVDLNPSGYLRPKRRL